MSVIKLSKNDIIKNDDEDKKIKLKKNQISYDSATASGWETEANESFEILKKYQDRVNNQEFLSFDDLEGYKSAMDSYIENNNRLRGINKTLGKGFTEDEEKEWNEYVSSMQSDYTHYSDYFSKFKDEQDYTDNVTASKYVKSSADEIKTAIDSAKTSGEKNALLKTMLLKPDKYLSDGYIQQVADYIDNADEETQNIMKDILDGEDAESYILSRGKQLNNQRMIRSFGTIQNAPEFADLVEKGKSLMPIEVDASDTFADLVKKYETASKDASWSEGNTNTDKFESANFVGFLREVLKRIPENKRKDLLNGKTTIYDIDKNLDPNAYKRFNQFLSDIINYGRTIAVEHSGDDGQDLLDIFLGEMTDTEFDIYNAQFALNGSTEAEKYLAYKGNELNYRKAQRDYNQMNQVEKVVFGFKSGLDNWESGFLEALSGYDSEYVVTTKDQYQAGMARESLGGVGKFFFDINTSIGNMVPQIITSIVVDKLTAGIGGKLLSASQKGNTLAKVGLGGLKALKSASGASVVGLGASGNAYQEAINLGFSRNEARSYAALAGAMEGGMEFLLNGVTLAGGSLTGNVLQKATSKLNSGIARFALKMGGSMASEGLEEYLQEVLGNAVKNLTLGTNYNIEWLSSDAFYAALLGAVTAGFMESPSVAVNTFYKAEAQALQRKAVDDLFGQALSMPKDSRAYKLAKKLSDSRYELNQDGINNLVQTIADDSQNIGKGFYDSIVETLTKMGETGDIDAIAKSATSLMQGAVLTDEDINIIQNSKLADMDAKVNKWNGNVTFNEIKDSSKKAIRNPPTDNPSATNIVPNSPEYIETVAKMYEEMGMPPEQAKSMAMAQLSSGDTNTSSTAENLSQSKFEVSDDGKTINLKTGKEVNISKIDSISESGEANLTLDDRMVVKASDVSFGTVAERAFIEEIGNLKLGKERISTASANALYQNAMTQFKANPNMTANEAVSLIKGLAESYIHGAYNFGAERLTATDENGRHIYFAGEISETSRRLAYEHGAKDSVAKAEADQKVIDDIVEKAKANKDASSKSTAKKGRVRFDDGVKAQGKLQKRTVALAKHLAKIIGMDIVFYDARTTRNPDGKGTNGFFDEDTDTIYLDLQNSHDDAKTIVFTLSHELVHFIKKWSPKKFDIFAKFLMEQYTAHGVDTEQLLNKKMAELGTTDKDLAYEEMICDACETMLLDSNAIYKLMELRKADLELFDKIKLHIHELLNKISAMYKSLGLKPTSDEAKALIEMKDVLEQIYSLFEEASVDAVQNYQAVQTYQVSQKTGFVGKYTNKTYTPAQAELLASLSVEALQNAVNSNGALSFNAIGLGGNKVAQQAWIDAGLTYSEDGNVFVDDNAVMDERDRRREAKSISNQAIENSNRAVFGEASVDVGKTESGIKNQLKNHKKIGEDAISYNERHKNVHKAILQVGIESMYEMAEVMLPYLKEEGILPPDIPGKTIFKNGSYGKTGENTTLCVRTLTYEDFKDRVAETLGRPLTVSESLLVSQKIYEIATDPQCIYCYVAADRKAYDEYLGEYWKAMDKYIKAMRKGGDSKSLYTEYLAGRKDTDAQKNRWASWEAIAKSGKEYISTKDLTTKRKRDALIAKKNAFSEQIKDAQRYAQSASWAKTVFDYRAYKGDILKMSSKLVAMLNSEYGLRMYSFSDYTPAFIVENMQMIIDASVKGLKSLAYTKDTDYAEIFASTGQAINVSCFAKWDAELGTYVEDNRQGANWEKTKSLRKQYRNVGAVMVATNDAMVEWALKQDWVDVVIPYHIVKTGTTIANEYQWNNYTSESADRVGNKTANIYPTEHNNDFATYSNLLNERGITPRFSRWYNMVASGELTENQYMKLVNEVRLPASELSAVVPSFNLDAAKNSFGIDNEGKVIKGGFVDKGGYMGGWYRQGVDVNQEVMAVSEDIKAGKSSLDVDYGMSKVAKEKVEEKYTHSIKKQAKKSSRITFGMSDTQRSEILKSKALESPIYEGQADETISINKKDLESQKIGLVKAALVRIGDEFNVFADYDINDVQVKISLSRSNLKESVTKDVTPVQLAKLLPLLKVAVGNAVGIESHSNRYYYDTDTVYFENLLGGYIDGEDFVPIRFGLKHSVSGNTTLYVVVDQNKIKKNLLDNKKTEVVKTTNPHEVGMSASRSVVYNISQIFAFVNSKDLLRYIPDNMLSDDQRISKWEAVAETIKKTDAKNDKKYAEYISKGNLYEAQRMVNAAAKEAGAILDDNGKPLILYRGTKGGQTVFAKETTLNGKIYTIDNINVATKYGDKSGKATEISNQVEGEPTTYALYGFPKKMLTLDAQYGVWSDLLIPEELLKYSDGRYKATNAEIAEWAELEGYDALRIDNVRDGSFDTGSEVIFFDENLVKSADTITKDNNDNIIPISERFDSKKRDIRYQKKKETNRTILANSLESAAQNDIERNKLAQYKEKISLIEAEEQRLSEIQKQLFTAGAVDPKQRKELQFEAKRISNRINTYDRQLLNLESTTALKNVLNREKSRAMKRQKQKDAEALKKYKEKVAKAQRELMERHAESRKKATEGRNRTAMRHKIKTVVNDLNNLLLKPSKERHVPEELRIAVAEALKVVNMDTVGAEERIKVLNEKIAKAKDPDVIASLTETRDRILAQGNKLSEKLTKLKEAYEAVRDSTDDSLSSIYDEVIYNKIGSVQKKIGKTSLRDMTLEQLESVYELYTAVLTIVRNSNKAFAEDLKLTRQALGFDTFTEIKENNKARDRIKHESAEKFLWQNLKPMQAMKKIGSATLQKLWNNILYGQEVFAKDYDEAVKFAIEMKEKYGYEKWDLNKLYSFESKSGKPMKINLEQMMSIYAYSKRAQADEHIEYGGIVLNEGVIKEKNKLGKVVEVKVNDSTAYRLNKMQVGEIVATLEKEFPGAKDFVDEMQRYLSETMGAKGNEVSMKLYGIKLFKEEHYFPLKSSKDFMEAANAKLKGDVKIKNKGMTKSTVEHARNPIVLENFLDVWGNHVNEMGMYHGLVLPLEDFSRTLNFSFKADEKLNTDAESVRTALHDAFGDSADNYLNELLKAINGGVLHDSSAGFADRMISKFKKAKVMASLSVIVQQPTAIIRAMGIIEPKYFVAQNFKHKATWEELKKYCPTAIIKETGSFDTNMGRTIVDMIKDDRGFTDKVGDFLGKAPAYMDEIGWNMIWRALKNKVATEQNLSGEALLEECGKQMTLIINETQVYDSVMARNELMRSKGVFTKMATAFMAEPTTVANMIYGAALDAKRGKKGIAAKTVAAVVSSVVVNGLVSAMVYALRDDDEDETFLEKYISSATTEVLDGLNPLTYIPFIKDAYSLFQGYKVERTDMALFGDVYDALNAFYNVLDSEAYEGMSAKEIASHIYENSVPLLTSVCDMFGLPVGNVLRDAKAVIVNDSIPLSQSSSMATMKAFKEGLMSTLPEIIQTIMGTDTKQDELYDAIINGDTAYVDRLKSGYKDEKAYETALRKALRENDPRIKEAAEARFNGEFDEYERLFEEIEAEGNFEFDTIKSAINTEFNKLDTDDEEEAKEDVDKVESIYSTSDINAAFENGDTSSALEIIDDIVKVKTENYINEGEKEKDAEKKAKSSVKSSMTSYWKPLYIAAYNNKDNAEMARIRKILLSSGLYGRANDVIKTGQDWIKNSKK